MIEQLIDFNHCYFPHAYSTLFPLTLFDEGGGQPNINPMYSFSQLNVAVYDVCIDVFYSLLSGFTHWLYSTGTFPLASGGWVGWGALSAGCWRQDHVACKLAQTLVLTP